MTDDLKKKYPETITFLYSFGFGKNQQEKEVHVSQYDSVYDELSEKSGISLDTKETPEELQDKLSKWNDIEFQAIQEEYWYHSVNGILDEIQQPPMMLEEGGLDIQSDLSLTA